MRYDGELYKVVDTSPEAQYPEVIDMSLPDTREEWNLGVIDDPVLGILYR